MMVRLDPWKALSQEERRSFAPLSPDLVVELASTIGASPGDGGPRGVSALRRKMAAYQANAARLGWRPVRNFRPCSCSSLRVGRGETACASLCFRP